MVRMERGSKTGIVLKLTSETKKHQINHSGFEQPALLALLGADSLSLAIRTESEPLFLNAELNRTTFSGMEPKRTAKNSYFLA